MTTITIVFLLVAGHFLADFALQNDYVAKWKSHKAGFVNNVWPWVLSAHAFIHGLTVYLITGSIWLGMAETAVHWVIDYGKSDGWYGYHFDQWLHILCKLVWTALILWGVV